MARIDSWLVEWAESVIEDTNSSCYSAINVVERILKDPGISTDQGAHRVLWWPKNRRVSKISRAAHQITPIDRVVLIVHYGHVLNDDKTRFTKHDLAQRSSIGVRRFNDIRKKAKSKLSRIIDTYRKQFDKKR